MRALAIAFAAGLVVGPLAYHFVPVIGPGARIERLSNERDALKAKADMLERFQQIAADDAQSQADQCQARVDEARRSTRAIETIVTREVPRDPQGCHLRPVVGSDELRDALQPAPPAKPLHSGSR